MLGALADLSEAVGKGFERVDKNFTEVHGRFELGDRQMLEIRNQLDRIESMILKDHDRRIRSLEQKLQTK